MYNDQLVDCYTERGNWHYNHKRLQEALGDYEQVFQLKLPSEDTINVQDKLLKVLRTLKKYELFQRYWYQFAHTSEGDRLSHLLTLYADYKIYLKDMGMARRMLLKAIELNKANDHAQESLQVVYRAGHTLMGFSVLWSMHGCHDKALISLEKALDTNPLNPGFTMLKAVVLRLSGRLEEATAWLQSVNRHFSKLIDPTSDVKYSILGKLSVHDTRNEMIKQWYLIQYEKAMQYMLQDKLEAAAHVIYKSKLTNFAPESHVLLGDCFLRRGEFDLALESYLKYRKMTRESQSSNSAINIDVMQRIIDILNKYAENAIKGRRSKDAVNLSDRVIQMLNEDELALNNLGTQRGHALLNKTRGIVQMNQSSKKKDPKCCETAAEGLVFLRDPNDTGLYRSFYGDRPIEETIDRFTPKKKLPRSLKILMQYS
ncbi:uncharacterized protein LOC143216278 [Lasioglossum baleicum]|uniref:uncharacterized protein LOC143216278 n=1 Tax=Lasioglossum baleicum TaxID=434251 RepID=UPI003FCE1EDE